jgi:uncharacterized protein YxjI
MIYDIAQDSLLTKDLFNINDASGALQYRVRGVELLIAGHFSLCSPSGEELAAIKRHSFRRQSDIFTGNELQASVEAAGLGVGEKYNVSGPAGELTAAGDFLGRQYTLTVPSGQTIATVSQRPGFRENFDVETAPQQDDLLLLAVIMAIEDLRGSKGAAKNL